MTIRILKNNWDNWCTRQWSTPTTPDNVDKPNMGQRQSNRLPSLYQLVFDTCWPSETYLFRQNQKTNPCCKNLLPELVTELSVGATFLRRHSGSRWTCKGRTWTLRPRTKIWRNFGLFGEFLWIVWQDVIWKKVYLAVLRNPRLSLRKSFKLFLNPR